MRKDLIIGNAAGTVKYLTDVVAMCRSGATRVTLGSITLKRRTGNLPAPRATYHFDPRTGASINALGLNNLGIDEYEILFPDMLSRTRYSGKEFAVSVAGFSAPEFAELAGRCAAKGVGHIELNVGCPNVHVAGERKPIISYDPNLTAEALMKVREEIGIGASLTIGIKISPIEDENLLRRIANAITRSGIVTAVVACNTIPDQRIELEDGSDALAFQAEENGKVIHTGGLAGEPLREKSLWVVGALRRTLLRSTTILGVGGISKGQHMKDQLDAGADGWECATAYVERGLPVFTDIFEEYSKLETEAA